MSLDPAQDETGVVRKLHNALDCQSFCVIFISMRNMAISTTGGFFPVELPRAGKSQNR